MQPVRKNDFEIQRARGLRIEKRVAQWFMKSGWMVLPGFEFSGPANDHAPIMQAFSASESAVIPDLLVARAGIMRWVEVKLKTSTTPWREGGWRKDTGLAQRHWVNYERVRNATGADVWISFAHELENQVTCDRMVDIAPLARLYDGESMDRGGMCFFPWDNLTKVGTFDEIAPGDRTAFATCKSNRCKDKDVPACQRSDPKWPLCEWCQSASDEIERRYGRRQ